MKPRILIVDDHEIVREGIRNLLARSGQEWEICGEASSASEAIVIVKSVQPEVIILDVTMPGISGLEAARLISKLDVPTRVLIFTMHESERMETEVRDSGAHGYVSKSQAARDLVRAIQTLLVGGTFFGAPSEPSPATPPPSTTNGSPDNGLTSFAIVLGLISSALGRLAHTAGVS